MRHHALSIQLDNKLHASLVRSNLETCTQRRNENKLTISQYTKDAKLNFCQNL
jgi:hypothetical protein